MSVVALRIQNNKICIAADTQLSSDDSKHTYKQCKLFKASKDFCVATVGKARISSLLEIYAKELRPDSNNAADILKYFNDFKQWLKLMSENEIDTLKDCEFILIFKKKAFNFDDYYLREVVDYCAIGSGSDAAMGAMSLGHSAKDGAKAACNTNVYCSEPILSFTF